MKRGKGEFILTEAQVARMNYYENIRYCEEACQHDPRCRLHNYRIAKRAYRMNRKQT